VSVRFNTSDINPPHTDFHQDSLNAMKPGKTLGMGLWAQMSFFAEIRFF
jgi:hypothetical protein